MSQQAIKKVQVEEPTKPKKTMWAALYQMEADEQNTSQLSKLSKKSKPSQKKKSSKAVPIKGQRLPSNLHDGSLVMYPKNGNVDSMLDEMEEFSQNWRGKPVSMSLEDKVERLRRGNQWYEDWKRSNKKRLKGKDIFKKKRNQNIKMCI